MRLELTLRGDYAVRTMLALAVLDGTKWVSARRIAERMEIPVRFLPHVLTDLVRAGLVVGMPGRTGGYRLARPEASIDLLAIVDAVEEKGAIPRCVLRGGPCGTSGRCAVHDAFASATKAMRDQLASASLADLAANGGLPAVRDRPRVDESTGEGRLDGASNVTRSTRSTSASA